MGMGTKSASTFLVWLVLAFGFVLLLAGNAGLQENCGSSGANSLAVGGTVSFVYIQDDLLYIYLITLPFPLSPPKGGLPGHVIM